MNSNQTFSPFLQLGFLLGGHQPAVRDGLHDDGSASAETGGERSAKWTAEEHGKFVEVLEKISGNSSDGSEWEAIAEAVGRSEADVKRHAQHYFLKLEHERSVPAENFVQVLRPSQSLAPSFYHSPLLGL